MSRSEERSCSGAGRSNLGCAALGMDFSASAWVVAFEGPLPIGVSPSEEKPCSGDGREAQAKI